MKRLCSVILTHLLLLSLVACNRNPVTSDHSPTSSVSGSTSTSTSSTESEIPTLESTDLSNTSSGTSATVKVTGTSGKAPTTSSTPSKTSTTTSAGSNQANEDKPNVKNTANLMNPVKSTIDSQANALRDQILNSKGTVNVKGTTWYISNKGDDHNDGNHPDKAWATVDALNYYSLKIKPGDAVLFERGGVYRGTFTAKSGVYYGAYGTGDKPCIYGSKENSAKSTWTKQSGNIWMLETDFSSDVGIIVFDHGKNVGVKKLKMSDVKSKFDFCYDKGKVYLYMDKNPASAYKSIEIGFNSHIITMSDNSSDIIIENLCLKYTGAHAVRAGHNSKNITVRNCEIGWIGGSILTGYGDGTTRYGNGVEFWRGCDTVKVEYNWIYQIYDSGITHQGTGVYVAKNITFSNNLLEYCGMGSIEYWLNDASQNSMENVLYSNNIMRFAGYGWGAQRPDKSVAAHILGGGQNHNKATNFRITNNIFELSTYNLVTIRSAVNTLPVLSGNTYIQTKNGKLGAYGNPNAATFHDNVLDTIKNVFKDTTAKVVFA